jgi:hypothetical protein
MTEMTSVGSDLKRVCLCENDPKEVNSILALDRQEIGHDGCYCHNAS